MSKKDYLSKLHNFLHKQIPDVIINILRKTGYDTSLAIESLNNEEIEGLEKYISESEKIKKLLVGTQYSDCVPFTFLPGHKILLLGLKKKTIEFEQFQFSLENKSVNVARSEGNENLDLSESDLSSSLPKPLLTKLIGKVKHFVDKKNIDFDDCLDEDVQSLDVGEIEVLHNKSGKLTYKTLLKCIVCTIRVPCYHDSYWNISNYEAHLKKFHTRIQGAQASNDNESHLKENTENSTADVIENSSSTSNISTIKSPAKENQKSVRKSVQQKLNDVLKFDHMTIN